jgi:hypothetical protein
LEHGGLPPAPKPVGNTPRQGPGSIRETDIDDARSFVESEHGGSRGRKASLGERGDVELDEVRTREPKLLREVARNNPPAGAPRDTSLVVDVARFFKHKTQAVGAKMKMVSTNGIETNRYAFGPLASSDVSIQHTMSKEQSFAQLRETQIPLPKREPNYRYVRNPREDMNKLLINIRNKQAAASMDADLRESGVTRKVALHPELAPSTATDRAPAARQDLGGCCRIGQPGSGVQGDSRHWRLRPPKSGAFEGRQRGQAQCHCAQAQRGPG